MAGYSKLFAVGAQGGAMGAGGIDPIDFIVLVGGVERQWLEPRYFDRAIRPLGSVQVVEPASPDHPHSLMDACIAFCPRLFRSCPSLAAVESVVRDVERLNFHSGSEDVLPLWDRLREEAAPLFAKLNIWRADLVLINPI